MTTLKIKELREQASKLGYKLVKKTTEDKLREAKKFIPCDRCVQFKSEKPGKALHIAGEKGEFKICTPCYNYVSMY